MIMMVMVRNLTLIKCVGDVGDVGNWAGSYVKNIIYYFKLNFIQFFKFSTDGDKMHDAKSQIMNFSIMINEW